MSGSVQLSVIMTIYNLENYLKQSIESVLKEKRIQIELILVDDCSSDLSREIAKQYADFDSRVVLINNELNLGITTSRNRGIRESKGQYVYIMDGDDILADDALYTMYTECIKDDLDILEFSAEILYEEGYNENIANSDYYYAKCPQMNFVSDGPTLFSDILHMNNHRGWYSYLHCSKGSFLRENQLYYVDGLRYADGSEFHLFMKAKRVKCIEKSLYIRRFRDNSQVTSKAKIYYLESLIVLFVEEMKLWNQIKDSFAEYFDKKYYINEGIERYFLELSRQIIDMNQQFLDYKGKTKILEEHPDAYFYFKYILKDIPLCINVFTIEQIDKIKNASKVYLYGAGFYGTQAGKLLDYLKIPYQYVISDNLDKEQIVLGKKVSGIDEISFAENDLVIITMSKKYHESVYQKLSERNISNYLVFKV